MLSSNINVFFLRYSRADVFRALYLISLFSAHASKIKSVVDQYMAANQQITEICKAMSNTTLVNIDTKRQYRNLEFHEAQREHRTAMEMRLTKLHNDIVSTMRKTFEVFRGDGPEVLQQWKKYTMNMDVMIEDALRLNVKKSLMV
jgi:dynein heavy chain